MEPKIEIYLPEHATSTKVFHVLSKFIGTHNFKERDWKKKIDLNIPAAIGNDWEIKFNHPYNSYVTRVNEKQERIKVCDFLNFVHFFDYYPAEKSEKKNHNEQLIISEANAIEGVFAKKLVDFFGGKMIVFNPESPSSDSSGINYIYECFIPIHPAFKKGQSVKKYKHHFTNELASLEVINAQQLVEMYEKTLWTEKDNLILNHLDYQFAKSYFAMQDLTKDLVQTSENTQPKRMKV